MDNRLVVRIENYELLKKKLFFNILLRANCPQQWIIGLVVRIENYELLINKK